VPGGDGSAHDLIPFNRPFATGREAGYVAEAIANGHLSGNGPFSRRCAAWLDERIGSRASLLTHSCTGALEMAVILAEIGLGDEVVMPSFTFVSTANAVALRGGVPVFVDVRPDTLNLDETLVEAAVTDRTRGILAVHYAGVGCELNALADIAGRHGLALLEDAAQGFASTYDGRALGGIGSLGALSFHETKNVMCGEGGALLVNDPSFVDRAEVVHEKGTDRRRFFRGEIDKYTWVDIGSSFLLSDLAAAFLWAQLELADEITSTRMTIWERYHGAFAQLEGEGRLRRPVVPANCTQNAHMYYVLLAPGADRDAFIARLSERGVHAVFHYVPLHTSAAGLRLGRAHGELPVTDDVSERLVRLPLWPEMTDVQVDRVIEAVSSAAERP